MNGTHSYLTKIKAITVALSHIAQIKLRDSKASTECNFEVGEN